MSASGLKRCPAGWWRKDVERVETRGRRRELAVAARARGAAQITMTQQPLGLGLVAELRGAGEGASTSGSVLKGT